MEVVDSENTNLGDGQIQLKVPNIEFDLMHVPTDTDTSKTYHTQLHPMKRSHNVQPNVEFNFDVSVRDCMLSTDTCKSKSTLGPFSGICPGG